MLVSILQHPLRARAPAPNPNKNASAAFARASTTPDDFEHPLGLVPHTLRGFLSNWSTMQIVGEPYPHCSACSDLIVDAYEKDGWSFIKKALGEKGWVEEVSGLAEVQRRAIEAADAGDVDWEEDDDGDGELL
jgi:ubiquitin-like modifier-activating enzyme ATG7